MQSRTGRLRLRVMQVDAATHGSALPSGEAGPVVADPLHLRVRRVIVVSAASRARRGAARAHAPKLGASAGEQLANRAGSPVHQSGCGGVGACGTGTLILWLIVFLATNPAPSDRPQACRGGRSSSVGRGKPVPRIGTGVCVYFPLPFAGAVLYAAPVCGLQLVPGDRRELRISSF